MMNILKPLALIFLVLNERMIIKVFGFIKKNEYKYKENYFKMLLIY